MPANNAPITSGVTAALYRARLAFVAASEGSVPVTR
jgi:hypothetical protein